MDSESEKYYKGHYCDSWGNLNIAYVLDIVSMLNFLNMMIVFTRYVGEDPSFSETRAKLFRGEVSYL